MLPAGHMMTTNPLTLSPEALAMKLMLMSERKIHHLLRWMMAATGIVTQNDIARPLHNDQSLAAISHAESIDELADAFTYHRGCSTN